MAAAFTQDAVLHFLQVRGGSVKNSDLLLHFRDFLQDGADRDRNRELFKKFVNSVASVRQIDGVSFVVLKKKFQGYVAGSGAAGGSSGPPWVPAGKNAESPALSPALSRDSPRQKAEQKEQTTAAPPGEPAGKAVLPAAGILLKQQVSSTPELLMRPGPARVLSPRPELNKPPDQASKGGQQRVGFGPLPGITPEPPHRGTSPVPETLRGGLQPEVDPHPQLAKRHVKHRQSYKTAVSYDDDDEEEVPMRPGSAGGGRPLNALLGDASSPCIRDRPAPSSAQKVYIQGAEADTRTPRGPAGSIQNSSGNSPKQQVSSTPEGFVRPGPAQVVSHIPDKPELNTPSVSKPPATGQTSKGGQHRVGFAPPPHIASEPPRRETSPVPETLRGGLQPEGNPEPQLIKRRVKHRQSYKAALSYDEEEEEEEEEVVPVMRRGSAGGAWPLNTPLSDTPRVMSTSSPCIIDAPAPPFFPQGVQGTQRVRVTPGLGPGVGPRLEPEGPARRSLPLETERHMPPAQMSHRDTRHAQPAGVHPELKQGSDQSHKPWLSSSHSSIFSPSSDAGFSSSEWPPSDSTRASGWTSSSEDLQSTAGEPVGMPRIQGTVRRAREPEPATHRADGKGTAAWHRSTGHLYDEQEPSARLSPLHRSSEQLHEGRRSAAQGIPWHFSTGDLYDDHEEVESSDSSIISSPYLRQHPGVTRRLSVKQRSRMCRSLGTDLDQLHQEEARREMERGGGHEEARQSRLHRISSSLSLRYNLSSSSLSSCSTPPRCQSFASLDESVERGRTKLPTEASPSSTHHEGRSRQSSVPLGSREHAWLVKGAAGTWPDIYSLFREDSSLLNRRDFISGFTVLHWIAKHGDHRVLNTLWYGVEKAGLTFDVNARATSGHTPLHIAAMHGHKNIIHLLVKKFHADVKQRDVAGKRPWQYLSRDAPLEILQLLGAPMRIALTSEGGVGRGNSSWEQQQQQRRQQRHLRHHISSALGERPFTVAGAVKVKRSSSLAAFLKHKSLHRFYAQ